MALEEFIGNTPKMTNANESEQLTSAQKRRNSYTFLATSTTIYQHPYINQIANCFSQLVDMNSIPENLRLDYLMMMEQSFNIFTKISSILKGTFVSEDVISGTVNKQQIAEIIDTYINELDSLLKNFLNSKPDVSSIMDYLGPWPWYILSLEVVALAAFFILLLPFIVSGHNKKHINNNETINF
jgi:uncharacterized membrane protein YwaF